MCNEELWGPISEYKKHVEKHVQDSAQEKELAKQYAADQSKVFQEEFNCKDAISQFAFYSARSSSLSGEYSGEPRHKWRWLSTS